MNFSTEEQIEFERLEQLSKYNILDSLTEKDYEDITYLASSICNAPIALISFVDKDRQWFKSHHGLTAYETPREYSFCAHAIKASDKPLIVSDSREDTRFKDNPLVTGDPKIVFYAGFPLVNKEGFGLGTLCVIDNIQRELTEQQMHALEILSSQVMNLLELRRTNFDLQVLQMNLENRNKDLEQFAMVLAHDIKSPLSIILLANDIINRHYNSQIDTEGINLINKSTNAAVRIKNLVDGILEYYKNGNSIEAADEINMPAFFESLKEIVSSPKPYEINYNVKNVTIHMNKTLLDQIFFNLIDNSIRYNDKPITKINLDFKEDENNYYFTLEDNGIGISEEKLANIFDLFTTVATVDSFGNKGHGIGLSTIKKIIGLYNGNIEVASTLGEGTRFSFNIQKQF